MISHHNYLPKTLTMKNIYLLLLAIPFGGLFSCSSSCDCEQIYRSNTTGELWYSRETQKAYTGKCVYKYGSGKIKSENEYKNGKMLYNKGFTEKGDVWTETLYDEAGDVCSLKKYFDDLSPNCEIIYKNQYLVSQKEYFSNKQVKSDIVYIPNTIKDPSLTTYSSNDNFSYKSCEVGSKVYFDNGQISNEIPTKKFELSNTPGTFVRQIEYTKEGSIFSFICSTDQDFANGITLYVSAAVVNGKVPREATKEIEQVIKFY